MQPMSRRDRAQHDAVVQSSPSVVASDHSTPVVVTDHSTAVVDADQCVEYQNTELWGDVLGVSRTAANAGECCARCKAYAAPSRDEWPCNVWQFCGDEQKCGAQHKLCILKHLSHPEAVAPAKRGKDVEWSSGTIGVNIDARDAGGAKATADKLRTFHIVTTAQGAAVHWQVRIHYYWYQKQKWACEQAGPCEMGGFTRLLHSGSADDLMHEIPTVVVDPLPKEMVDNTWYVVLNRPYAFVQWVKTQSIPEKYVLMAEPDHVYIRPLKNLMTSDSPAAFPFFYIEPAKQAYQAITKKFTGDISRSELDQIAPIGNSPTFMTLEDMRIVMPLWMNVSIAIFKDPEASKAWGWVQEMYGFAIGLFLGGVRHVDLYLNLMSQPPWDMNLDQSPGKPFYIIHYTYGMDYKLTGEFTPGKFGDWRFDKRTYGGTPVPRKLGDPPVNMKNDLVRKLIDSFNEATAAIPCWDEYAKNGQIPATCDEAPGGFIAEHPALFAPVTGDVTGRAGQSGFPGQV
ncbi:hypothetical protein FOA52_005473 [Chlamydomonas sp. UWO 241]|nr:hypothetical protein FOA52_005473 [Chlamydomonas sp. UWO 241]